MRDAECQVTTFAKTALKTRLKKVGRKSHDYIRSFTPNFRIKIGFIIALMLISALIANNNINNIILYRGGATAFYPFIGFIVGVLVGTLGVGGGSILTPTLILALNVSPIIAVGSDLVHSFIMKSVGAVGYYRQRTVNIYFVKRLLAGAIPSSILWAFIINFLGRRNIVEINIYMKLTISAVLILCGLLLFLQVKYRREVNDMDASDNKMGALITIGGVVVGSVVSLTSIGAGVLLVPLLIALSPNSIRNIVGTDIFTAIFLAAIPGLTYLYFGSVDISLVGALLLGSIPGVLVGLKINSKAHQKILRILLGMLLIFIGSFMILWRW